MRRRRRRRRTRGGLDESESAAEAKNYRHDDGGPVRPSVRPRGPAHFTDPPGAAGRRSSPESPRGGDTNRRRRRREREGRKEGRNKTILSASSFHQQIQTVVDRERS